jgi:3-(3-hydroxy-phenyl)propionate hydroxylase
VPWQLDWATVYSANTLTLPDYRAGRVLFTGDAAHLLPIFGVRGANTGFQDGGNLAWKLALVAKGEAPEALLDSYSAERVQAAREICDEGGKSTRFMTPPTAGYRLLRDAVLSLSLSEAFPKDLLHWRTSRAHTYADSPLNSFAAEDAAIDGGVACGDPLRNVRLGANDYLFDHLTGAGFLLLGFAGAAEPGSDLRDALQAAARASTKVVRVMIGPEANAADALADIVVADPDGRIARKYAVQDGSAYLVRPDQHVCARWRHVTAAALEHALAVALGGAAA